MIINRHKNRIRGVLFKNGVEIPFDYGTDDARVKALIEMMDLYEVNAVGIDGTEKRIYYVRMEYKGDEVTVNGRTTEKTVERLNPEIDVEDMRYAAYGVYMMMVEK